MIQYDVLDDNMTQHNQYSTVCNIYDAVSPDAIQNIII